MLIFFLFFVGVYSAETHINYKECKADEFKSPVCEKYKKLQPPSER